MKLRPAQLESLTYHIRNPFTLDRSEPGTGKTAPACIMTAYMVKRENLRVVWIQSKSLFEKNRDELAVWTGIDPSRIVVVDGTATKKKKLIETNADVWLMGAEAFNQYGPDMLKLWPNLRAVVVDEAHLYYSNFQSARTQKFLKMLPKMKRVNFLTATPIKNGNLASAYTYAYVIDRKYYLSYSEFMNHHTVKNSFGEIESWTNHETLNRFFQKYTIKHSRKDVYGDAEIFVDRQELEMAPAQRKAYDTFVDEGLLDFQEAILDGREPGVKAMRLRQICNHPHKMVLPVEVDTKGNIVRKEEIEVLDSKTHTPKLEFILDWLKSNEDEPLIIFAPLVLEQGYLERMLSARGISCGLINGSVSGDRRSIQDQQFKEGKIQVMICSPKTAGIGFNWGHVNTIIYHSLDYGDQDYTQSLSRAVRGIRTIPLQLILLEYKDSIDSHLLWAVHHKSITTNLADPTCPIIYFPRPKCHLTRLAWDGRMNYLAEDS